MPSNPSLTPRQRQTLLAVAQLVLAHGVPPTVREVGASLRLRHPSAIRALLLALVGADYLAPAAGWRSARLKRCAVCGARLQRCARCGGLEPATCSDPECREALADSLVPPREVQPWSF